MPNRTFVFARDTDRTIKLMKPTILRPEADRNALRIRHLMQSHAAVLQSMNIEDLSSLGKLSVSGNVIPTPGLTKPQLTILGPDAPIIYDRATIFHSAPRISPRSAGDIRSVEKIGGTAHSLKVERFPTPELRRARILDARRPGGPLMPPSRLDMPTSPSDSPRLFAPMALIQIPVAYWVAGWIDIADDTNIVFLQPNRWLVMIANQITIGNHVTLTWEQIEKSAPPQPAARSKLGDPPQSTAMGGRDGADGRPGDSSLSGPGAAGDDGPEVEIWALDVNRLPEVLVAGQDGFKGGKGQNGQAGQDGAKGKDWVSSWAGANCSSGPGNGGDGGDGGDGAKGGRGGDGGHGGQFNLYAPSAAVAAVSAGGFYVDTKEGQGGPGGDGGEGGNPGDGGEHGADRDNVFGPCSTSYGENGSKGDKGDRGAVGGAGRDGDHYADASSFYPISPNDFNAMLNKPAIIDLSADEARVGDVVTAVGSHFTRHDKVYVEDGEARTTVSSDTLLTFTVPDVEGGRQKSVQVHQQDGTTSNRATIHIKPKLLCAEYDGARSTDTPPARFTPGTQVTLVGTGFAPGATVRVMDASVSGDDVQFIDSTRITFRLIRPASTPNAPDGEPVQITVVLSDGSMSNQITIVLDTYVIAVFGDSIQWGQGLKPHLKFHSLVENHIKNTIGDIGIYKKVLAHSGAGIGVGISSTLAPVNGEVPTFHPTILQQVDDYSGDGSAVDLVLLDGGINDVGVPEIVSPIATSNLSDAAHQHCGSDMEVLLRKVAEEFPNARIVVTGYYRIVTDDSDTTALLWLLAGLGMLVGGLAGAIVGGILSAAQKAVMVERSRTFATEANRALAAAADAVETPLNGGRRIRFVAPNFGADNAIFAPHAWLWGIDADLSPADEESEGGVAESRGNSCDAVADSDEDRTSRPICKVASIGHPNVTGASKYAEAIIPVLG